MSTIKVNGAAVPSPSELKVTVFDVSSGEARSASGGLVMDRIAACKVYRGKDYTDSSALEYYQREKPFIVIHPETRKLLEKLLVMLSEEGEKKTFAYMRRLLKKGDY